MSNSPIRVLIVDDHTVVRQGLEALLETERDLAVVGGAADGEEALVRAEALRPDVVLMDLVMPRLSGVEAIAQLRERVPEAHVLVLTSFHDDDRVYEAIEAGALGYLLKDVGPEELVRGIREVARGTSALDGEAARALVRRLQHADREAESPLAALTDRERDVLVGVARGASNGEIARDLGIGEPTVRTHVSHVLRKLDVPNRTRAALLAIEAGLLDDTDT